VGKQELSKQDLVKTIFLQNSNEKRA